MNCFRSTSAPVSLPVTPLDGISSHEYRGFCFASQSQESPRFTPQYILFHQPTDAADSYNTRELCPAISKPFNCNRFFTCCLLPSRLSPRFAATYPFRFNSAGRHLYTDKTT